MQTLNTYQFCFDLLYNDKLKSFLPIAYIVNHCNTITYVDKKANLEIIRSYGIDFEKMNQPTQKLFNICEILKTETIFKKFGKNIKTAKTIDDLLKDSKIAFGINQYIAVNLQEFLQLIYDFNFQLSLNLGSKKEFYNYQLAVKKNRLLPKLQFDKDQNGITYSLFLQDDYKILQPSNHQIDLLLDQPCWIVLDKQLYQVDAVNSKKLMPFLKKKFIEIPTKIIPEFFEKFIKDIAQKVEIEATGFEVIQKNKIENCYLTAVDDFFKKKYFLDIVFDYDGYLFNYSKSKKTHATIDLSDLENIKVIQFKRNANEVLFENKLLEIGFQKTDDNLFTAIHHSNTDIYENVQWLIDNKQRLETLGFSLDYLKLYGKKLITAIATIQQTNELINDWFDVKMIVNCGAIEFNFTEIIGHIKSQNRIYHLSNGCVFLIPLPWFADYSSLVTLSKNEDGILKLPKSNFVVLNHDDSKVSISTNKNIDFIPSDLLKASLRPYQVDGVKWLLDHYKNGLGACLADDMGLGKTLQTLAVLVAIKEQLQNRPLDVVELDLFNDNEAPPKEFLKALIVLPSSLIFNWYNETKKFAPHLHKIRYIGQDRKELAKKLNRYDIVFTSYAIVSRDITILEKYNFRYLILDESQYIKNKNSNIFKALSKIHAENKLSLSGTPIENSLNDLWSQMQFINPNILGSYTFFNNNFKIPIQIKNDEKVLAALKLIINPFILRRTKEQVLKDLPELNEQVFYCTMEPEQEKLYEEEKSKARNYLLNNDNEPIGKINIINSLMRLRQLSNHPKMIDKNSEVDSGKYIAVINHLQTLVLANKKTIVFSSFLSNLSFYKDWCKTNAIDFCELSGDTSLKDREIAVNRFQNNDKPLLFFISLKAGGVGLNITKASFVLFLDPWWNPFQEKQGISRAHRIGQENKVTAIRFITKNTVEEKILLLQEKKKLLSASLLDENFINPEIEENLNYILE